MAGDRLIDRFIRSSFGSIWSLELLLMLRERRDHGWTRAELIAAMRASDAVLDKSLVDLERAGLIASDANGVRYAPAAPLLDATVEDVAQLYATRPAFVRRLIVGGGDGGLTSFADAFRLRRP